MTAPDPVHAFGDDALGNGDATEVAERIRDKRISAAEACEAAVERARRMQPFLNAVECADYERALASV